VLHNIGNTLNIPLNQTGMGDSDYMFVMDQLIAPIAREFNPDLVLISAGTFLGARGHYKL
jgi:histone deacetylase 6